MSRFLKSVIAIASSLITAAVPVSASAASALDLNLPSLGSTADAGLSPQDEYRLGTQLMAQVRADPTYLADPEIMDYLGRLGYQLVSHARSSTYNFFFFPIRDDTLNAFALPGGYIAVHTGTIIAAQSESELAGDGARSESRRAAPYCPHD